MTAKLAVVPTHRNRSKARIRAGENPTPAQVRRAREAAGLTLEQASGMVHTHWRTWQHWESDVDSAEHRRMHPATWELFQVKLNAMKLREQLELAPSLLEALGLYLPDRRTE
jgi:hypothetical protein